MMVPFSLSPHLASLSLAFDECAPVTKGISNRSVSSNTLPRIGNACVPLLVCLLDYLDRDVGIEARFLRNTQ